MRGEGLDALLVSHRTWWSSYYPASFVSVANAGGGGAALSTALEGFYWLQQYKLGSATRPGGVAIDLMGPWFQPSGWLFYWFDLNVQLTHWPMYGARDQNPSTFLPSAASTFPIWRVHRESAQLAATLTQLVTHNVSALQRNEAAAYPNSSRFGDAVPNAIGGACPATMECGVGLAGGGHGPPMVGDGMWIMHNLYMHASRLADESMLRDVLFPLLRGAAALYLSVATTYDGALHLPPTDSPEYPHPKPGGDANYDLALCRWGLTTLVALGSRYHPSDVLLPQWRFALAALAAGPTDVHGWMVNNQTGFDTSHRHFSHLFHAYPLHLVDARADAAAARLVATSLDRWTSLTCPGQRCPNGFTYTGAASISALLGRASAAAGNLTGFIASGKVHRSTMYSEGGNPCIESPLAAAASSLQELLLTSWGGHLRIFPAVPDAWPDAVFSKLLAEGAVEVSGRRTNGTTSWVELRTLRDAVDIVCDTDIAAFADVDPNVQTFANGTFRVRTLKANETVLVRARGVDPSTVTVDALPGDPNEHNYWGSHPK